jgi:hypothetical protein
VNEGRGGTRERGDESLGVLMTSVSCSFKASQTHSKASEQGIENTRQLNVLKYKQVRY